MKITIQLFALITVIVLAGCSTTPSHHDSTGLAPIPPGATLLAPPQSTEARQAARRFLEAVRARDWKAVVGFWPPNAPKTFDEIFTDRTKDLAGGLKIIGIGTPYKEGSYRVVFVPYEVRFENGQTQANSLRLTQASDGRWVWVGGF
jgi:hypothetical protein